MRSLSLAFSLGAVLAAPALLLNSGVRAADQPPPSTVTAEGREFFEKRIRPVLAERCYACHSAATKNAGGLLLDTREGLLKGGTSGPSVSAGNPDGSRLIQAVRYHGELKMPPGKPLPANEVADLEAWVKMGAPDPRTAPSAPAPYAIDWDKARRFWSFQPLRATAPPAVKNRAWVRTPIDQFVLAKLEAKGLKPVADADRRTLIRRVTFDLTGLPPAPEEVSAFLADRGANAWEKVIDRLLASPAYGERWARHWLDQVRYADTSGCNSDFPIPTAYKYRNWVIQSISQDLPYDQFLRCQIAGDLLPARNEEERHAQIIATGYLALARRFGSQANEFHLTLDDTIDNLGKATLGLSVSCARCHDHKFDPITQKDYYGLYGILQSTKYAFPGTEVVPGEKDLVILATGPLAEEAQKHDAELSALGPKLFNLRRDVSVLKAAAEQAEMKAGGETEGALAEAAKKARETYQAAKAELDEGTARQKDLLDHPVKAPKAFAVSDGKPENARVQIKGDPKILGDEAPRGFLQVLGGQKLPPEEKGSGRLELAQWITDPQNPLTPRVMANRIWQFHFGKGIVATPSDFGARGQAPTHPELLDYLAREFIHSGWSLKAMHRMMCLSHVYQLSSVDEPRNLAADVSNSLLWRYNRHRLDAESIRDAMLAVGGNLERGMGAEHPFPPRAEWKYTQHKPFYAAYETERRSIYLMQQRIRKQPFLAVFDGADPNTNTAERPVSTTAIQALYMLNDPFVHQQARKLAERVSKATAEPARWVDQAYLLAYGRSATPEEQRLAQHYLSECRAELAKAGVKPEELDEAALASLMRVVLSSNEFVFLD